MVMVFGEITTKAKVDYEAIVRRVCKEIGFTSEDVGLNADTCKVRSRMPEQSVRQRSPGVAPSCMQLAPSQRRAFGVPRRR